MCVEAKHDSPFQCVKKSPVYPVTPSSLSAYIATELGLLLKIQLNTNPGQEKESFL